MTNFNFNQVEKGKFGHSGGSFPDDVVRLRKKTISFGESVSKLFAATKYQLPNGDWRIKVAIATDNYHQAIQLTPSGEGFTMPLTDNGHVVGALPRKFAESGLPLGDYRLVEGERNVFQLAR